jgi:TRAP-type C4-dicarboxylate transport system substrate-binding protein
MDAITKVPIRTLNDFSNKKLAGSGSELNALIQSLGAVPINIGSPERWVAADRGVIDGEIVPFNMGMDYKMYEVEKNYTKLALQGCNVVVLVANLNSWNKIPADIQQVISDAAKESSIWHGQDLKKNYDELIQFAKDKGVAINVLSDQDKATIAAKLPDLPKKFAADMDAKGIPGSKIVKRWIEITEANGWKWVKRWGQ